MVSSAPFYPYSSRIFFFVLAIGLLTACQNHVHYEYHDVPKKSWDKSFPMEYLVVLENTGDEKFSLKIGFSYIAFIDREDLAVVLKTTAPSGKVSQKRYAIPIKDADGEHLGDVAGDYGDIEYELESGISFAESGDYLFQIIQDMPPQSVGGITRVGLILDASRAK